MTTVLTWEGVIVNGDDEEEVPVNTCEDCGHAWVVFDLRHRYTIGTDSQCRPCANDEPETVDPKWWRDL